MQKGSGTFTSANPFPLDPLRQCVIYTDGALDSERAIWGAIVVDTLTSTRLCFAGAVPTLLLDDWETLVGDQLICQIERFAVLCIRWRMRHLLKGRRLLLFIDNEPCRYALIKGRSAFVSDVPCLCLYGGSHALLHLVRKDTILFKPCRPPIETKGP